MQGEFEYSITIRDFRNGIHEITKYVQAERKRKLKKYSAKWFIREGGTSLLTILLVLGPLFYVATAPWQWIIASTAAFLSVVTLTLILKRLLHIYDAQLIQEKTLKRYPLVKMRFSETLVTIEERKSTTTVKYEVLAQAVATQTTLLIMLDEFVAYFIPAHAFHSNKEKQEFAEKLNKQIASCKAAI